jgi:gamma-glutamyltranspeptidase/glutathione hydrolase
MLSKEYAAIRRGLINPDKAIDGEAPFGNPRQPATSSQPIAYAAPQLVPNTVITGEENGHTTYLAVIDKDRNMVSVTSSLLSLFGSGHVVEGAGFVLNNRMAYYGLDEDDVNVLRPGKRVRQTINPALALKDGKPYMVFGTPGADTQPQAQMQFFLNVVEFGMNVQQALEQDYVVSTSFKSSYYPHNAEGKLQVPSTLPKHVLDELAAMGHKLDIRNVRGVGSVKAIIVHPRPGVLMGGVSPTRDSYVMAYGYEVAVARRAGSVARLPRARGSRDGGDVAAAGAVRADHAVCARGPGVGRHSGTAHLALGAPGYTRRGAARA